jgi:hypothetical protein
VVRLLLRLGYPESEVPAAPCRSLAETIETPE